MLTGITDDMLVAADAIAATITDEEFNSSYVISSTFNVNVADAVAIAGSTVAQYNSTTV